MSQDSAVERLDLAAGYSIPRVVVGLWQLSEGHRAVGPFDPHATVRQLERFVDAGLDTFDCADIYTGVEELVGRLVRRRPGRVQVHTKFVPDRDSLPTLDRRQVEQTIDRSLARLGVEQLDLVQFHWWDWEVDGYVETAMWLDDLRAAGKIRHLGTTNFDAPHLLELLDAGVDVISDQVQYSLLDRRPAGALSALAQKRGLWMLCYGTLAGGFLTDHWRGKPEPGPPWSNRSLEKYALIIRDGGGWDAFQRLLSSVGAVADEHGVSTAAVATRAVLGRDAVAAAIIGARDASRLPGMLETFTVKLTARQRATIERQSEAFAGPPGAVYALERDPAGAHAAIMRMNLNREG